MHPDRTNKNDKKKRLGRDKLLGRHNNNKIIGFIDNDGIFQEGPPSGQLFIIYDDAVMPNYRTNLNKNNNRSKIKKISLATVILNIVGGNAPQFQQRDSNSGGNINKWAIRNSNELIL